MCHGWRHLKRLHYLTLSSVAMGLLAGCTVAGPAEVRLTSEKEPWSAEGLAGRRIITEHFDIFSTLVDAEFEDALPEFLELVHERFQRMLPAPAGAHPRLAVYVFATRGEWEWFTQHRFPTRQELYSRIHRGGYTEGAVSASFYTSRAGTLVTLAHESWHQYVDSRFGTSIPAWLNEGLACYHEALHMDGARPVFTPRHNTFRMNSLCEAVQRDTLMSLEEIVDTDAGQVISRNDSRVTRVYYAQAWALVTFLRFGAGGRHAGAFERLLTDVAAGTFQARVGAARLGSSDPSGISAGRAAFKAYFGPIDDLDEKYYDHLVRVCRF